MFKRKLKKYIKLKMKELSMNIDDFSIGDIVINKSGKEFKITNKSETSIELYIERNLNFYNVEYKCVCGIESTLNKKAKFKCSKCLSTNYVKKEIQYTGVNCKQWFTMNDFNRNFKIKKNK